MCECLQCSISRLISYSAYLHSIPPHLNAIRNERLSESPSLDGALDLAGSPQLGPHHSLSLSTIPSFQLIILPLAIFPPTLPRLLQFTTLPHLQLFLFRSSLLCRQRRLTSRTSVRANLFDLNSTSGKDEIDIGFRFGVRGNLFEDLESADDESLPFFSGRMEGSR